MPTLPHQSHRTKPRDDLYQSPPFLNQTLNIDYFTNSPYSTDYDVNYLASDINDDFDKQVPDGNNQTNLVDSNGVARDYLDDYVINWTGSYFDGSYVSATVSVDFSTFALPKLQLEKVDVAKLEEEKTTTDNTGTVTAHFVGPDGQPIEDNKVLVNGVASQTVSSQVFYAKPAADGTSENVLCGDPTTSEVSTNTSYDVLADGLAPQTITAADGKRYQFARAEGTTSGTLAAGNIDVVFYYEPVVETSEESTTTETTQPSETTTSEAETSTSSAEESTTETSSAEPTSAEESTTEQPTAASTTAEETAEPEVTSAEVSSETSTTAESTTSASETSPTEEPVEPEPTSQVPSTSETSTAASSTSEEAPASSEPESTTSTEPVATTESAASSTSAATEESTSAAPTSETTATSEPTASENAAVTTSEETSAVETTTESAVETSTPNATSTAEETGSSGFGKRWGFGWI